MKVRKLDRCRNPARRGSLIIEAVVAITLLTTAFIALGKLATSSAALSVQADQRLAATMCGENVLERLRAIDVASLSDDATDIGDAVAASTGFEVNIETEPFQVNQRKAMHLTVTVKATDAVSVTLHDWRIAGGAGQDETEGDDA